MYIMKRYMLILMVVLMGCSENTLDRNPYLQEVSFTKSINLNLPLYNSLNVAGNAVFIGDDDAGIRGVIVINQGFDTFRAWEATCPNHTPSGCSTMNITGGTYCRCSCDDYQYNLYTGDVTAESADENANYNLLYYQTSLSGNTLTISN